MTFNEEEMLKIKKATSGFFKGRAKKAIAQALNELTPKITHAKTLPQVEKEAAVKVLMNKATDARHLALAHGANSYSDPEWAAAAACESWLHELALGTEEGLVVVEKIVRELRDS